MSAGPTEEANELAVWRARRALSVVVKIWRQVRLRPWGAGGHCDAAQKGPLRAHFGHPGAWAGISEGGHWQAESRATRPFHTHHVIGGELDHCS